MSIGKLGMESFFAKFSPNDMEKRFFVYYDFYYD